MTIAHDPHAEPGPDAAERALHLVPPAEASDPAAVPASFRNTVGLSNREASIVRLVAQGHSNDEISQIVWLSLNTIKSYLRSAYRRMDVDSRTQAVVWAFDHGLVTPAAH